jgi:hypothetical protein
MARSCRVSVLADVPARPKWPPERSPAAGGPCTRSPRDSGTAKPAQLTAWGFTERRDDHVHTVYRGPRGGTLRVIRSQLGRADPSLVEKAARLAGVTPDQFWSGPERPAIPASPPDTARAGRAASRRKRAAHDSIVSLVLAIHAEADRPLGFDQVAELSGNRVTREQVSTASSALRRDGQLDRIRSGVYQWSRGQRTAARTIPAARRPAEFIPQLALIPAEPAGPPARQPGPISAAELFSQLFPDGVQMTGELFADLEQWLQLTTKLAARSNGTTR